MCPASLLSKTKPLGHEAPDYVDCGQAVLARFDSGHYGIDSTTVRAHVSAAGGKGDSSTSSWPLAGWVQQ